MTNTELESKLDKSLDFLKGDLAQISTGRASPAILDDVKVTAYETQMSIREVASIALADPQNIIVTPWDRSLVKVIAKAIRESDLNINPIEDTDRVRIQIPSLTEERRIEFAKQVAQKIEDCKTSLRNIRQEAMKDIDQDFNDKEISEDDKFILREEVEETVREYLDQAEEMGANKKEEIMTV